MSSKTTAGLRNSDYYYDWENHSQPNYYDWANHRPPTEGNFSTRAANDDTTTTARTSDEKTSARDDGVKVEIPSEKDASPLKEKEKSQQSASLAETLSFVYRCGLGTRLLFLLGTISGIAHGLAWPALAYFLSRSYQTMSKVATIEDDPMGQIRNISFTFMALGTYSLGTAFLQTFSLELVSSRATRLFQLQWFKALLRQDAAFFDVTDVAGMAALVGPCTVMYNKGIGRKLGEGIQNLATG
jgi:hypothetical protein